MGTSDVQLIRLRFHTVAAVICWPAPEWGIGFELICRRIVSGWVGHSGRLLILALLWRYWIQDSGSEFLGTH